MLHIRDRNKYKLLSIIQARVSSQRLPGKVLLKLGDSNVIGEVIKRAKIFSDQVVICTSKNKTDDYKWVFERRKTKIQLNQFKSL